jgi:predicted dehydrogenase
VRCVPSGVIGHFDCSLRAQFTHLFDVRGAKGRIVLEQAFVPPPDEPTFIRFWKGDNYQEIRIDPVNQYTLMGEDFADALLNHRPPRYQPQDGVQNMQVIDKLLAQVGLS